MLQPIVSEPDSELLHIGAPGAARRAHGPSSAHPPSPVSSHARPIWRALLHVNGREALVRTLPPNCRSCERLFGLGGATGLAREFTSGQFAVRPAFSGARMHRQPNSRCDLCCWIEDEKEQKLRPSGAGYPVICPGSSARSRSFIRVAPRTLVRAGAVAFWNLVSFTPLLSPRFAFTRSHAMRRRYRRCRQHEKSRPGAAFGAGLERFGA